MNAKWIFVIIILLFVIPISYSAEDCSAYPGSYFFNRSFSFTDNNYIPGTDCKCNTSVDLFSVRSSAGWECKNVSVLDLVENSTSCLFHENASYGEIYNTGFCCPRKHHFNDTFVIEQIENGFYPCWREPNQKPVAFIFNPKEKNISVREFVKFSAKGSYDPDYEIVKYEWDFGFKGKAWGYLQEDNFVVKCVSQNNSNNSCTIDKSNYYGELNLSSFGNPCVCKSVRDYIFEKKIISSEEDTILFRYPDKYACDPYNKSTICELTLTVYDDEGATDVVSANISLYGESFVWVNDTQENETSDNETDANDSYIDSCLNVDCPVSDLDCQPGQVLIRSEGDCCVYTCSESVCGDGICDEEGGETTSSCSEDCYSSSDLEKDISKSKGSSAWIIVLVILAFIALLSGGGFLAWQQGWLDPILKEFNIPTKKKDKEEIFDEKAPPAKEKSSTKKSGKDELSTVKSYIKSARSGGLSYSQIKKRLVAEGWDEKTINKAFNQLK